MKRRSVLLGGAQLGATLAFAGELVSPTQAAKTAPFGPGEADGLPMPPPEPGATPRLPESDPSRTLMEHGWRFHEGDVPFPEPADHNATYLSVKAGNATGAASFAFDDSDWQEVTLPHDWASFQDVTESANVSEGYRRRGIGWYRRLLKLDPSQKGRKLELHFDAIATHATIWVNGSEVAHSWSGYTGTIVDLTPFARYGDDLNWIAVRVDATAREGWWYEGAGLYRHVWLVSRAPVSIATDGVHCHPVQQDGAWTVPVSVTLENIETASADVSVHARLLDPEGKPVTDGSASASVPVLESTQATLNLTPGAVRLWSPDEPVLYTVEVDLQRDGKVVDSRRIAVGFRTQRFDANEGFLLNGTPVKLKGVCLHQDHAGVGVAVPDALMYWRLQRLKAMGCNAIRMSHNAAAAELLDWCDRLGFLVMAENRLFDPAPDYIAQLKWMVRRDRNHPSIILWSVFNEEPMQGTHAGVEMVRRMRAAVRKLDTERPVTGAMNGSFYNPENVGGVLDVMGFNYYQADYDKVHAMYPERLLTSSEDTSAYETRGAFASVPQAHVVTSLDKEAASWGATHRETWREIASRPFIAGGFAWTGFDYHGEPTPYAWPTVSSFFGILDLCGFPKTAFGIRSAHWREDAPMVWLAPHWTWPGHEGKLLEVFVISNAEALKLRLNGKVIETVAKADRIMGHTFKVPYEPGRIEAMALNDGKVVARAVHETVGPAVALRLTPSRTALASDGEDVTMVTVDAVDARGRHVPTVNAMAQFTVSGGNVIGVGNGDPNCHESGKGLKRSLFNGLAQVIVQGGASAQRLVVTAKADGLKPARLQVAREARSVRDQVPAIPSQMMLADWRRSALFAQRPDPSIAPADGDNNSWDFVHAGTPAPKGTAGWRGYRTAFTPWRKIGAQGGTLHFASITGRAEVWLDGQKIATKAQSAAGPLDAPVPAGKDTRKLLVLVQAEADTPSGLTGPVSLTA
ncbi:beta-galactosidase GalA [Novosphingobium sp. 9]|uniref:beta-galactosidase GalA n=1 Tax=Novosphingobium sp. 9 TaxID=2025349 RepID=UPI0021B58008|nr:beta-galactosidase GalA [Novosphingobium sp. 9]